MSIVFVFSLFQVKLLFSSTTGGTWTHKVLPPGDFKSPMFTNFITVASEISLVHTQGLEPRTRAL